MVDECNLLNNIGLWGWRMQERDISVFQIWELDCEIKHMVLKPSFLPFISWSSIAVDILNLWRHPKREEIPCDEDKKQTINQTSCRKEVKECRSLVWLQKSPQEVQVLLKWHIGAPEQMWEDRSCPRHYLFLPDWNCTFSDAAQMAKICFPHVGKCDFHRLWTLV